MKNNVKKDSAPLSNGRRAIAPHWHRSAPDHALRRSGISIMPRVPWGTHICLFYETKDDLIDAHVSYFEAGLANNERCIWTVCPPVARKDAIAALRHGIADIDEHLMAGRLQVAIGHGWCVRGTPIEFEHTVASWCSELREARQAGFDGLRLSCCALWRESGPWAEFLDYEKELDKFLDDQPILALCTYWLSRAHRHAIEEAAELHQGAIAIRRGGWEFLEVPGTAQAKHEIRVLNGDLEVLPKDLARGTLLTQKEKIVLAQIVRGAATKEAARALGVSPRTIEFHRANIMKKLGTRNIAALLRRVFSAA